MYDYHLLNVSPPLGGVLSIVSPDKDAAPGDDPHPSSAPTSTTCQVEVCVCVCVLISICGCGCGCGVLCSYLDYVTVFDSCVCVCVCVCVWMRTCCVWMCRCCMCMCMHVLGVFGAKEYC
jgi:hypothetical protein